MARWIVVLVVGMILPLWISAQGDTLTLTLTSEESIAFECLTTTTQQPSTSIVWVLFNNCLFGGVRTRLSLRPYDLLTRQALTEAPLAISGIDNSLYDIDRFVTALAFTPEGDFIILASDNNTSGFTSFKVNLTSGEVTLGAEGDERLNALLFQFSEYPIYEAVFSADHRYAAIKGEEKLSVIEVATEELLFEVQADFPFAVFSPNSDKVYVTVLDNPDDFTVNNSTLTIYETASGEVLRSLSFPSFVTYPSPDGRYIGFQTVTSDGLNEELGIVETETGRISTLLPISEPPSAALACANTGRSLTDFNYQKTGTFNINGWHWLPDASGFITVNTHDGTLPGRDCLMDSSRLRQYTISGN